MMSWRNVILVVALSAAVVSCAPVLNRQLMDEGTREFDPSRLIESPDAFKGRLFIFGGVIVDTRLTEQGSQIELLFVPVNSYGYLAESANYRGRVIAIYPRSKGFLDPMIYKRGREITVAGNFLEVRRGKIDEMGYAYPVFEIRQIYLWEQYRNYPYYYWPPSYYPYPYYYGAPYLYDPWGRPYFNPYWPGPW
jgi:outer membrane lipoprotein